MRKVELGDIGNIDDFPYEEICKIPEEIAMRWIVNSVDPNVYFTRNFRVGDIEQHLRQGNGGPEVLDNWPFGEFIIVEETRNHCIAVCKYCKEEILYVGKQKQTVASSVYGLIRIERKVL